MTKPAPAPKPLTQAAPDILKVSVEYKGQVYEEDLSRQVGIQPDLDGLNQAFSEYPGRFALWAMIEVYARDKYETLVRDEKVMGAELFSRYQVQLNDQARADGAKAPNLDVIWSAVYQDPKALGMANKVALAKLAMEQVRVGRQTMEEKKYALQAIGANWRAELDSRLAGGPVNTEQNRSALKRAGDVMRSTPLTRPE